MRSARLSRYAFLASVVAMGFGVVLLATGQAHLYEGGTLADRIASAAQDAGVVALVGGGVGVLMAAIFICRSARSPECLFYAAASAGLVLATLLVMLITGLNVHSWTFFLFVPTLSFSLCVGIFLIGAAFRKLRPSTALVRE